MKVQLFSSGRRGGCSRPLTTSAMVQWWSEDDDVASFDDAQDESVHQVRGHRRGKDEHPHHRAHQARRCRRRRLRPKLRLVVDLYTSSIIDDNSSEKVVVSRGESIELEDNASLSDADW